MLQKSTFSNSVYKVLLFDSATQTRDFDCFKTLFRSLICEIQIRGVAEVDQNLGALKKDIFSFGELMFQIFYLPI